MHYGELKKCDIANGAGVRVTLFVSGCTNRCEGCFQPQTWDFCYGKPFTADTEAEIFAELDKSYVDGLTLLGGEPFEPKNQPTLTALLRRVKAQYPHKTVWCYSGYTYEADLLAHRVGEPETIDRMLGCIDILVDGRFVEAKKSARLRFRGSANQRIIDVRASLAAGQTILWEGMNDFT